MSVGHTLADKLNRSKNQEQQLAVIWVQKHVQGVVKPAATTEHRLSTMLYIFFKTYNTNNPIKRLHGEVVVVIGF